jgi:hypothetical protein
MRALLLLLPTLVACDVGLVGTGGGGDLSGDGSDGGGPAAGGGTDEQPAPAEGNGLSDPPSRSLHNPCRGIDWQRVHGWTLHPHAAPEIGPAGEIDRCVDRYAGWVTHAADDAGVSRASVYAALAAQGGCDEAAAPLAGADIGAVAQALGADAAVAVHHRDPPLMAAFAATGAVTCGGDDRWRLSAPPGYIDRYVHAYNAVKARASAPPACRKRIVVTAALYTGMDDPGVDGVAGANGCWTYERVSKPNEEWKICNYDGTVHHPDGWKWVYDDTNTAHDATTEKNRLEACKAGVPGRGYVYMTNRGAGWPKVVTAGVAVHFAEIYSGQLAVDDQFTTWKNAGAPGDPMVNFGEPTTGATRIRDATARACAEVADGGYLGVYVYPESLRGDRMSAMVRALDQCTAP